MCGESGDYNGFIVFVIYFIYKLLNVLLQVFYIYVCEGCGVINFFCFNQVYMMYVIIFLLYVICVFNDVVVLMMDGNSGLLLIQEVIDEVVDFCQVMVWLYKEFIVDGSWFFKLWNKEVVIDL